jgi:hypothetical protein
LPASAAALLSVGRRYSDWRYAGQVLTDEEQEELVRSLRDFRLQRAAGDS